MRNFARRLRQQQTDAEQRLWYNLRARRFCGLKFRRQYPVGPYIVDFACLDHKLVIEVDGGQHLASRYDYARTAWLQSRGFRVIRFWNDDVLARTDAVLEEIHRNLTSP